VPFRDAFTILHTTDVARLAAFYVERFGFERRYRWPDEGEAVFLIVTLGAFSIGLSKSDSLPSAGRVAFWLYTEDLDGEIKSLRRHGVDVVAEPAETKWGERMATLSDADGNHVHVGQRL
jgi:lactoylglutathione lyase